MEKLNIEGLELTGYTIPTPHASLLVIRAPKGMLGCGYINAAVADKLNDAAAIVSGVKTYDDMLAATRARRVPPGCDEGRPRLRIGPSREGRRAVH